MSRDWTLVGLLALVGCGQPSPHSRTHPLVDDAIARTDVVTLANRRPDLDHERYPDLASSAWLAETPEQLRDLWAALGLAPASPIVDFSRYAVLGERFFGGCEARVLVGAQISADHRVTLELADRFACASVEAGWSRAVAVPRAFVGERFVWSHETGFHAFELGVHAAAPLATVGSPVLTDVRGVVALPPPGHIALRTLDDGEDVWVAQHRGGDISVISSGDGGFSVQTPVRWLPEAQRFTGGFDSYGRTPKNELGLMPVQFQRDGESVRVGGDYRAVPAKRRHDVPRVPNAFVHYPQLQPASTPLELDGPAAPYGRFVATPFEQIADGQLGLVELDLSLDPHDEPRICRVGPGERCPTTAPAFATPVGTRREVVHGPLLVRRSGANVRFVMQFGER
jgi:hypothetical protein